ncbi:MAG TPA: hypothetical protein VME63_16660 [Dyella sp.]|uniref:hypothetical protein n=1 Tax=Dyella sp. TaxID=1869338 RepID=UPI002C0E21FF|nr:hypothetical protein [Dyella sp.]HTV87034.1 hypothetical protein [Dyella sp.]
MRKPSCCSTAWWAAGSSFSCSVVASGNESIADPLSWDYALVRMSRTLPSLYRRLVVAVHRSEHTTAIIDDKNRGDTGRKTLRATTTRNARTAFDLTKKSALHQQKAPETFDTFPPAGESPFNAKDTPCYLTTLSAVPHWPASPL